MLQDEGSGMSTMLVWKYLPQQGEVGVRVTAERAEEFGAQCDGGIQEILVASSSVEEAAIELNRAVGWSMVRDPASQLCLVETAESVLMRGICLVEAESLRWIHSFKKRGGRLPLSPSRGGDQSERSARYEARVHDSGGDRFSVNLSPDATVAMGRFMDHRRIGKKSHAIDLALKTLPTDPDSLARLDFLVLAWGKSAQQVLEMLLLSACE